MLWEAHIPERPPQQPIHLRLITVRFRSAVESQRTTDMRRVADTLMQKRGHGRSRAATPTGYSGGRGTLEALTFLLLATIAPALDAYAKSAAATEDVARFLPWLAATNAAS